MKTLIFLLLAVLCSPIAANDIPTPPGYIPRPPGWIAPKPEAKITPKQDMLEDQIVTATPLPVKAGSGIASYEVHCDEDAEIFIGGYPTTLKGTVRIFETHPNLSNATGHYVFKMRVFRNGVYFESEKTVDHKPGERQVVTFDEQVKQARSLDNYRNYSPAMSYSPSMVSSDECST